MIVIPAIDLKGGLCVRLFQGNPDRATVYSDNPVEMAVQWSEKGAERIHVVNLDGALGVENKNAEILYDIKEAVKVVVQFGGGLRDLPSVRKVLERGVDRAIIGTAIFKDPLWVKEALREYPGRLLASLDALNGQVMWEGWRSGSGRGIKETIDQIEGLGFQEIIFTDISRDGALEGPNLESLQEVLGHTRMAVYASGGITCLEDIKALHSLETDKLRGCIVGKALYDGRLKLEEAIEAGN